MLQRNERVEALFDELDRECRLVVADMKERCSERGKQTEISTALDVSLAYLNDVLHGRRDLSREMNKRIMRWEKERLKTLGSTTH